jgi:hypothetical protein
VGRAEPDQVRFLRRDLQAEFLQPTGEHLIEALGVGLQLEGAHEVVRIPTQVRCPLAVFLDGFLKPDVQGIVEVDVGEHR